MLNVLIVGRYHNSTQSQKLELLSKQSDLRAHLVYPRAWQSELAVRRTTDFGLGYSNNDAWQTERSTSGHVQKSLVHDKQISSGYHSRRGRTRQYSSATDCNRAAYLRSQSQAPVYDLAEY